MNLDGILQQLRQERDRLSAAINALQPLPSSTRNSVNASGKRGRGRPPLSASEKRKMSVALKAAWAKRKNSGKTAGKARKA